MRQIKFDGDETAQLATTIKFTELLANARALWRLHKTKGLLKSPVDFPLVCSHASSMSKT